MTTTTQKTDFYSEQDRIRKEMQNIRLDITKSKDYKKEIEKLRALDAELSKLKLNKLLDTVNREQARKRANALLAWECEQPQEDPTNTDGSFHKTKVKKYPKLAALEYARGHFKDGTLHTINIGGDKLTMCKTYYTAGQPDTYERPATFNEFLELNSIMIEDFTKEMYFSLKSELDKANEELENAFAKYSSERDRLNIYSLQGFGLITQNDTHQYKYELKQGY
jgi:hypothetical protein